ncbi:MAG: VCBS repeat-containing protein, partial [Nitrospirae bacterium]|nr:VCBS repeat-containing protein [Nitrospirota bacterium]
MLKSKKVLLISSFLLLLLPAISYAGWTWTPRDSSRNWFWRSLSSSSDGAKLIACEYASSGGVYISTDYGVTWSPITALGGNYWRTSASSSDGSKLIVNIGYSTSSNGGYLYVSHDSGSTWIQRATDKLRDWGGVASSSDGTKLVAVAYPNTFLGNEGYIYTSADSGAIWTPRDSQRGWGAVASSADGTNLVATESGGQYAGGVGGYIYTSTDSGVTWTPRATDQKRYWGPVASSADGTNLVAAISGYGSNTGQIYTSTDSGVTWTPIGISAQWGAVASSSDGTKLVAAVANDGNGGCGYVYISVDSGATWTPQTSLGCKQWIAATSSYDGNKVMVAAANDNIYTGVYDAANNTLTITKSGTGTGTVTTTSGTITWSGKTGTISIASGDNVTLTATPDSDNSTFTGWSGGGCTGTGTCTVTMSAQLSVTATFTSYSLAVAKIGTGSGTVTTSTCTPNINCGSTCSAMCKPSALVTLTASPASGSGFTGWGGDCSGTGSCTITMNGSNTVTATFTASYLLTVTSPSNGTISSNSNDISCGTGGTTCSKSYTSGTSVTLTATADSGYAFNSWGGACSGTTGNSCTVTMSSAKSVSATFTASVNVLSVNKSGPGVIVSSPSGISCGDTCSASYNTGTSLYLTATPSTNYTFSSWSGCDNTTSNQCTVSMSSDKSVTATFTTSVSYLISVNKAGNGTVTSSPTGISCGDTCSASYTLGTSLYLTATPDSGYTFSGWSGFCDMTYGNQCLVVSSFNKSVTATFIRSNGTNLLTVNKTGNGTITSSSSDISCGSTCSAYTNTGATVILTATPDSGYNFSSWTGCDSVSSNQCTITMASDKSVSATFTAVPVNKQLTVSKTGNGTITSSPSGISCGSACSASYTSGTAVSLTATPDSGYNFSSWTGCDSTNSNQCTVTMASDKAVTATFTAVPVKKQLTVSKTGNGTITSSPSGISCGSSCSASYTSGTAVILTATPDSGYNFSSWTGCDSVSSNQCTITISSDKAVTATFAAVPVNKQLTVSKTGNGTITSSPSGISCGSACSASYASGTAVILTATPDSGYAFTSWGGDCSGTTGNSCTLTMSSAKTVSATFAASSNSYLLTVTSPSNGTISSTSNDIICGTGGTTCSKSYTSGTPVILTAIPDSGYAFTSWGGACIGTTGNSCTVTMSSAKSVAATFEVSGADSKIAAAAFDEIYSQYASYFGSASGSIQTGTDSIYYYQPYSNGYVLVAASDWNMYLYYYPQNQWYSFKEGVNWVTLGQAAIGFNTAHDIEPYVFGAKIGHIVAVTSQGDTYYEQQYARTLAFAWIDGYIWYFGTWDDYPYSTGVKWKTSYLLTVTSPSNGTISSTSNDVSCGTGGTTCSKYYTSGASVALEVTPDTGYALSSWGGDCNSNTGNTCTLTMSSAKSASATFSTGIYSLAIQLSGTGSGTVSDIFGNDLNCGTKCSVTFPTEVTLPIIAYPDDNSKLSYMDGCNMNTAGLCTVVLDDNNTNITVTAQFDHKENNNVGNSHVSPSDYDGDGISDILLQNTNGTVAIWTMNDDLTVKAMGTINQEIGVEWEVAGLGDFDGDGKTDILYYNSSTGGVYINLMNNMAVKESAIITNGLSSNWRIIGIGDFDGDGKSDILWRDTDGDIAIYFMRGTSILSNDIIVKYGKVSPLLAVAGIGDFDGNGTSDILWRDTTSGRTFITLMSGVNPVYGDNLAHYDIDINTNIVGVGDFNGDGT